MSQLLIDFGFLNSGNPMEVELDRRWWGNLLHGWRNFFNNGWESYSPRSCDCLIRTWVREVDSVSAVHLLLGSNKHIELALL